MNDNMILLWLTFSHHGEWFLITSWKWGGGSDSNSKDEYKGNGEDDNHLPWLFSDIAINIVYIVL